METIIISPQSGEMRYALCGSYIGVRIHGCNCEFDRIMINRMNRASHCVDVFVLHVTCTRKWPEVRTRAMLGEHGLVVTG